MNSQTRFDAIKSKDFPGGDRVVITISPPASDPQILNFNKTT
jgi:hypothetical protein